MAFSKFLSHKYESEAAMKSTPRLALTASTYSARHIATDAQTLFFYEQSQLYMRKLTVYLQGNYVIDRKTGTKSFEAMR